MQEYQYTAFISYRHLPPDEAVAKKLHTLIENFSIPGDIKKTSGRKKMGRVFRDQEELPLSTDLGGDIRKALENSEWLIAVCSPRYPESRWCMTELDYFISLGKRVHILAILVDGDPEESFPLQLRTMTVEGKTVQLEPLAGDVRAPSLSASLKKLSNEKLRLLAPMLGVHFDDLRQRARRRKRRQTFTAAAAAFTLLAGFLTFALIKNGQIRRQNDQILEQNTQILQQNDQIKEQNEEIAKQRDLAVSNEMQVLIEQANISVNSGNKLPARKILARASALRETVGKGNDEALHTALEYALYTGSFETVQTIDNDQRQFSSIVFSHNDKYLAGITAINSATVVDAENGGLLCSVTRDDVGMLDSVGFTLDDKYFYTVDSWYNYVCLYSVETGELYRQFSAADGMAWNIGEKVFAMEDHRILIAMRQAMVLWDYESDTCEEIFPTEENGLGSYIQPFMIDLAPDGKHVAVGSPGYSIGLKILPLDGSEPVPLENVSPQRGYNPILYSGDGSTVAASSGNMFFVWNAATGKLIQQGTYTAGFMNSAITINYDGSVLLVSDSSYLAAFDTASGKLLWEQKSESNISTEIAVSPNGLYVCAAGGISGIFDIRTGEVLSAEPCTAFSNDGTKVLSESFGSDPRLLITPEAATARLTEGYDGPLVTTERYTEPEKNISLGMLRHNCSEFYSTPPGNANRKAAVYVSPDTRYAAYTHYDGYVETFDISDRDNVRPLYGVAEHCYNSVTDLVFSGDLMAACGGFDPRCSIFDMSTGEMLHVLRGSGYVHQCEFSPDGSKIMLLCGLPKSVIFVYSVQTGNLLYHYTAPGSLTFTEIGFSEDGSRAVALLEDGRALVGELYDSLDEMIEKAGE